MNNLHLLMEQPTQPKDKEHLQRVFAQADIRTGKALRKLLERLPVVITLLSEGVSFPIFQVQPRGKRFSARVKQTELICLLGQWRETLDRLELLPGDEQLSFLIALDEFRFRAAVGAAKATSKAIRAVVFA